MAYRRGARRPSKSEVVLIRTTSAPKMLLGVFLGLFFAFGGVFVLMVAAGDNGAVITILSFLGGLVFLVAGGFGAVGSVVEMFSPVRVYIDDEQFVIHKKRTFSLPKMTCVPIKDITGALVETKVDTDNDDNKPVEWYRVVLSLAAEERVPLTDDHYLSNMDEARRLAGRIEEMLKDARTEQ